MSIDNTSTKKLLKTALILSAVTIIYNLIEGSVSVFFGTTDEALSLFGFGTDSFVEVLSGIGIAHMVMRMRKTEVVQHDKFERQALRVTGIAFYILTTGLVIGAALSIYNKSMPSTTLPGIIIAGLSILTMYILYYYKLKVGKALNSAPIISDAKCTKTCFYLSFILLGASLLYELFKIPYVDAIGSLGIAWYAFKEGKEAFEKVKENKLSCSDDCC